MIQISQNHFGRISKLINSSLSTPLRITLGGVFFLYQIIIPSSFQGGYSNENGRDLLWFQVSTKRTQGNPKGYLKVLKKDNKQKAKKTQGERKGTATSSYMYICNHQKIPKVKVNHYRAILQGTIFQLYSYKNYQSIPQGIV